MRKPTTVWVVNSSGVDFADQYDGEKFTLPVSTKAKPFATEVPIEAAQLWFGMGESDPRRAIMRLGWATTEKNMGDALAKLHKFAFHLHCPDGHLTAPVEGEEAGSGTHDDLDPAVVLAPAGTVVKPQNLLAKLAAGSLTATG